MPLLMLLARVLVSVACARAGGGHSFHSSGGSFHSSGGSFHSSGGSYSGGSYSGGSYYSSDGDPFSLLIDVVVRLIILHPFFGVPLLLVAGYVVYLVYGAGMDYHVRSTISSGLEAQDAASLQRNLDALKRRDAAFEVTPFLSRMEKAFLAVQAAWSAMDMGPARAFVSDGVMERFTLQLAMLRGDGRRNDMQNVRVIHSEILQVESTPFWDVIHVQFDASALDRDVALEGGAVLRDGEDAPFEEVWTFARRPSARTLAGRGALEGQCPNCGSTLELVDGEQCGSCKSWLNSGEFDWVLCEITQESEWSSRDPDRDVPGFDDMAAKDPALNTRFLEDRAAVAFWRWQEALWAGKPDALRPVAVDALCESLRAEDESPCFFREAAVGAVITLACEPAQPLDRVHVVVRWSGERCELSGGSVVSNGEGYFETVFTLGRKAGAVTDAKAGLRSLRCASCGAPPSSREAWKCEYCGHAFNDGSRQWVLAAMTPAASWRMPQGLRRGPAPQPASEPAPAPAAPAGAAGPAAASAAATAPAAAAAPAGEGAPPDDGYAWTANLSAPAALRVMVCAMMADGVIDTEEQRYLVEFARARGIEPTVVGQLVQAADEGHLDLPVPQSNEEACAFLRGLVVMSLADGKIQPAERKAIDACAAALSLPPGDVDDLIERERQALYRRGKAALAARKQAGA